MAPADHNHSLAGETVALPESRRLDVFATMLEKRGARVQRCPLVAIHDAPDPEPVQQWINALIAGRFEDVILYTGEGVRRLHGFADRAGGGERTGGAGDAERAAAFVNGLARARRITRGPKPVKALREMGLKPTLEAEAPTTDGLIATLGPLDLAGRCVGVQMYGQDPNAKLEAALHDRGATCHAVYPYVYASEAEDRQVLALIRALGAGEVSTIAFTSSAQVDRLWRVARQHEIMSPLEAGLRRTTVAAVGPVVARALREQGLAVDAMPDEPFALKPLMNAIIAARESREAGTGV